MHISLILSNLVVTKKFNSNHRMHNLYSYFCKNSWNMQEFFKNSRV